MDHFSLDMHLMTDQAAEHQSVNEISVSVLHLLLGYMCNSRSGVLFIQKDEEVDFFREKFAGTQADRKLKEEADAKALAEQLKKTSIAGCSFFI